MLSSGCVDPGAGVERETVDLDHAISLGGQVSVVSENGRIQVRTTNEDRVLVHAVKESWGGESMFDLVDIVFTGDLNDLWVSVEFDPGAQDISVDLTVRVPASAEVVLVSTDNGDIDITGTRGNATLTTLNGWVFADGVRGFLEISTRNGRVEVTDTTGLGNVTAMNGDLRMDVQALKGDVEFRAYNGAISVDVSPDIDADVVITTTNGRIQFHDTVLDASLVLSNRVEGKVGSGGTDLTVTTVNGEIYFYHLL